SPSRGMSWPRPRSSARISASSGSPLLEERVETRPRLARRCCGCTVRRRPEVVAEVPRLLVRHSLCVRLAAVVVATGLVERAVASAVKVRRAACTDVAHADPLDLGDGAAALAPN